MCPGGKRRKRYPYHGDPAAGRQRQRGSDVYYKGDASLREIAFQRILFHQKVAG